MNTTPMSLEDPLVTTARREAWFAWGGWLVALVYTIGVCGWYGYAAGNQTRPVESVQYVLGFPDWVFWGLVLPWGVFTLFSAWFGLYYMRDNDLDSRHVAATAAEPPAA